MKLGGRCIYSVYKGSWIRQRHIVYMCKLTILEILQKKTQRNVCLKKDAQGAGEILQQLKALAALPEDTGLSPDPHMVVY